MRTYEEWRVTGTDKEGDPVSVTWWHHDENAKERARAFAWAQEQDWTDGPHLHKRTVAVTDWTEADT